MSQTRNALIDTAAVNGWEVRDGLGGSSRNLFFFKGSLGVFVAFSARGILYAEASEDSEDSWVAPRIFTERGRASYIASENVRAQVLKVLSA
jgi:hypothetical protein